MLMSSINAVKKSARHSVVRGRKNTIIPIDGNRSPPMDDQRRIFLRRRVA